MSEPHPADIWHGWHDRGVPEGDWSMRVGKSIGRNLYIEWPDGRSEPVGQVDTASIAELIVTAVNAYRQHDDEPAPHGTVISHNTVGGDLNITGLGRS